VLAAPDCDADNMRGPVGSAGSIWARLGPIWVPRAAVVVSSGVVRQLAGGLLPASWLLAWCCCTWRPRPCLSATPDACRPSS
jgi:hypothetical protein